LDLPTAVNNLDTWEKAQTAVSTGTSYSIGGRSLTRADINDINNMITYYRREVKRLSGLDTYLTPSWS
jgi:uncharacterized membrane protein